MTTPVRRVHSNNQNDDSEYINIVTKDE